MERQRLLPTEQLLTSDSVPSDVDALDHARTVIDDIASAADRLMDSFTASQAEQFLQANRQTSGQ
ncbi:MAG: hypothetical protein JNM18_19760 [Planctomycetaceae bacterium]|nr:hypothetical protein [Planctomycetaceae bacterium]